ncbi:MAG: Ig-like domain-containing protein [Ruminococcus flavefaciens]|nr:Ig-like domain-containing protein [Ruminococcus flavefaciens]
MIVKRIISAVTGIAVLASTATVLSGCGSLEEFFNGDSKKDNESSSNANDTITASTADGVITNGEWLAMVNDAFGMQVDESAEDGEIQAAKDWGVVGENETIDMNAPVDDKFVTTTLMRASGYATVDSSDEEVIQAAIEHGVISSPTESVSSPEQAVESLSTAHHEWSNKTFEDYCDIQLAENVVDMTETLNITDVDIKDDSVVVPSEYVESLGEDKIIIVPKEASDGKGGAYKVMSSTPNANGKTELKCIPATFEEVYQKVNVSGKFGIDPDGIEVAEGVSYTIDTDSNIEPLSYEQSDATIMPMGNNIQQLKTTEASKSINGVSFEKEIAGFTVKAEVKDINLNAKVDWEFNPFKGGLKVNNIYMGLNYTNEVSATTEFSVDGDVDLLDVSKTLSEPSLYLGKLSIKICPGLSVNLKANLEFEASGELKVVLTIENTKGFEMSGGHVRPINETHTSSELTLNGKVGAYLKLTLALSLDYLVGDVELFSVSLKVGPTITAELTANSDVDVVCAQVDGWLTIQVTVGFLEPILKLFDIPSSMKIVDIGKDDSPVRFDLHLENFAVVPSCTVNGETTTEATTEAVTVPVGIFSLKKSYVSVDVGSSSKIELESLPSGYSASDVVWESSNPSVASVDANGNISANSTGTTSITAKTKDGKYSASCAVNAKGDIVVSNNIDSENNNESELMVA